MTPEEFDHLAGSHRRLRIALVGDFCLDRYLEIDPARSEVSLETGLPVHNVVRVRSQPGGAGTILNNLVALGIGTLYPIGFHGSDGEGYELRRALEALPGVHLSGFQETTNRCTFTYCKPLLIRDGIPPEELNRFDTKNWTPTPEFVSRGIAAELCRRCGEVDAIIILDQVDRPGTGVVTPLVLNSIRDIARKYPALPIIADGRRGLGDFPTQVVMKMNQRELAATVGHSSEGDVTAATSTARHLAMGRKSTVFVTMAEHGILAAGPDGTTHHVVTHPLRGPIDIVGAGDAVTANLAAAMAAGASLEQALELANAAASIVIHQLGTTGTATPTQIRDLLFGPTRRST